MSSVLAVGTTAINTDTTPFARGFNVAAVNFTGAAIALTGSDTQTGTYTALVTAPTLGAVTVTLPQWIKAGAASVYLIG